MTVTMEIENTFFIVIQFLAMQKKSLNSDAPFKYLQSTHQYNIIKTYQIIFF